MCSLVLRQRPRQCEGPAELSHEQVAVVWQQCRVLLDRLQVWEAAEEPERGPSTLGSPLMVGGVEEHKTTLHVSLTGAAMGRPVKMAAPRTLEM